MNKTLRGMTAALLGFTLVLPALPALAKDDVSVAIGQRGLWDTIVIVHGVEEGFFDEENIEVDITWTAGGAETLQAVTTRSVDLGFVNGLLGVLGAYESGAPVRIVGAQMTGASDLFWYSRGDSEIDSLEDADGRSIGYSRPGASSNLVLLGLVNQAGIDAELVSAGGIPANRTQVMSGQLDMGWSVPPFNLDLVQDGELKIVARGDELEGVADQTVRVNISNTQFLSQRRDVAERFMRAYVRSVDWMYDNMDEAIARFAEFNEIDMDIAREAAEFYPKEALSSVPVLGLERTMQEAIDNRAINQELTEEQIEELIDYVYDPR